MQLSQTYTAMLLYLVHITFSILSVPDQRKDFMEEAKGSVVYPNLLTLGDSEAPFTASYCGWRVLSVTGLFYSRVSQILLFSSPEPQLQWHNG